MVVFEDELRTKIGIANTLETMVHSLSMAGPEKACIEVKDGSYVATIAASGQETVSKTFENGPEALLDATDSSPGFLTFSFHSYDSDGQVLNYIFATLVDSMQRGNT